MNTKSLTNRFIAFLLSFLLLFAPALAYATPSSGSNSKNTKKTEQTKTKDNKKDITDEEEEDPYKLTVNNEMIQQYNNWQDQVENANKVYEEHLDKYNTLVNDITNHEQEIAKIQEELAANKSTLAECIEKDYKQNKESTFLTFLFNSESFDEFINNLNYIEYLQKPFRDSILENKELKMKENEIIKKLSIERTELESELKQVESSKKEVDEVSELMKSKISGDLDLYEAPSVPEEGYDDVIEAGISRLGLPYVWGGKGKDDVIFDCSGLTHWCYEKTYGVDIGISTSVQYEKADQRLPLSEAQPGDVLFRFAPDGSAAYQHVAIYIGKFGNMEHAYLHTPSTGRLSEIRDGIETFDCVLRFNCDEQKKAKEEAKAKKLEKTKKAAAKKTKKKSKKS